MREWAAHAEAGAAPKAAATPLQLDDLEERRARLERELSKQKGDYEARLSAAADEAKVAISRLRAELGTEHARARDVAARVAAAAEALVVELADERRRLGTLDDKLVSRGGLRRQPKHRRSSSSWLL